MHHSKSRAYIHQSSTLLIFLKVNQGRCSRMILISLSRVMAYKLDVQQRIVCIKRYYSTNNISSVCRSFEEDHGKTVRWNTVKNLIVKFKETGSVLDKKSPGRPQSVNVALNRQIFQERLHEEHRNSGRHLSAEFQISQTSSRRIIKDSDFKI